MSPTTHVIIHGHFYQPPRENPWTQRIEPQPSAAPYRDWNERVAAECYTPNARSRVLDDQGRILEVVNNYEYISFNFGPTLLSWLEQHAPETYERILAADRVSVERRGHGNAMAQVYNHVIMPLASARDRWTQIQWGLSDFQARFDRPAAGMWLAETAVNDAVMEDLARAGVQFVILAPSQAEMIRAPGEEAWRDVSAGDVPCGRAYAWAGKRGEVAVLFYDGQPSQAIAFEHLLRNAATFADRIEQAAGRGQPTEEGADRLALLATDGESYGHHEPMGDMCLAYLATREAPRRGLSLTNPAAFLAAHPARWEVRLKPGGGGRGTAWSCAHGVGRWMEDCGCTTGGPPSWNQAWRAPLREAFDLLRQRADPLFEQEGTKLLTNPWAARDDYISVLLGRKVGAAKRFFDTHAKRPLTDDERARVYRLMEMQRHCMLMYTSCGWFFADLSGIETVQDLAYFARAGQLGEQLAGHPITAEALDALGRAESNLAEMGDGLRILRRFVRPAMLSPEKVAAHKGIRALLENRAPGNRLYGFRVRTHSEQRAGRDGIKVFSGRLTVEAERTGEGGTFDVAVLAGGGLKLAAFVRPYREDDPRQGPDDLLGLVGEAGFDGARRVLAERFGLELGLPDMLVELRLQAMGVLVRPVLDELNETFDALFTRHEGLLRSLQPLGVGLPEALNGPVGYAASRRFDKLFARGLKDGDLGAAMELAAEVTPLGVELRFERANRKLGRALQERLEQILADPRPGAMVALQGLIESARRVGLAADRAWLQDRLAEALDPVLDALLDPAQPGGARPRVARAWVELAGFLNLNVDAARRRVDQEAKS